MQNINSAADLREAIIQLENKRADDFKIMKEHFHYAYESVRPVNLIKTAIKDVTSSPDVKADLLGATIGIATGYLSKKILVGNSDNPIKILMGTLLQLGVSNVVSRNAEAIKSLGNDLFHIIKNRFGSTTDEPIPTSPKE